MPADKKKCRLDIALGALTLCLGAEALRSMEHVQCQRVRVPLPGLAGDVRFVLVSDLHGRALGWDNSRLVELVRRERPDLILLPGDLIDRRSGQRELERVYRLLRRLRSIAPVYMSLGNHEQDYCARHGSQCLRAFEQSGAVLLRQRWVDVELRGMPLRIGGVEGRVWQGKNGVFAFLDAFADTKRPTLLLSHRPESFTLPPRGAARSGGERWKIGLIVSGHTHGGLFRPFGVGLVVPPSRVYPRVYRGLYRLGQTQLLVGGGLAGAAFVPRLFNPAELWSVTLTPGK